MVSMKCANCGVIKEADKLPKKFVCLDCGALNTPMPEDTGSSDNACGCILPTSFEWKMPVGEVNPAGGEPMYATADDGQLLSRSEWLSVFGCDPVIVREAMKKLGKEGKDGFVNLSTLGKKKR